MGYYDASDTVMGRPREHKIDGCRTVAEGKRIFADWYAEHRDKFETGDTAEVKRLPSSPDTEFYPTPSHLAGQMAALINWRNVRTVLEPSAGKGDLIECAIKCAANSAEFFHSRERLPEMFDCIEIDENLRHILTGNGYRVVHDDFLTLNTQKHYDLILMNPPFSNGDEHLLKAISMQAEHGGQIVCLLNAETIRNPYTNRRKVLAQLLAEHGATVKMAEHAFAHAQRKTDVEVAIVYLNIPAPARKSFILDGLHRAEEQRKAESHGPTAMVTGDWVEQLVANFNMEARAGVALMEEYNALAPYIMSGTGTYDKPLIQLTVGKDTVSGCGSETVNSYLRMLRYKYWSNMLSREELTSRMTSQMQSEYSDKVEELQDYDFSRCNVEKVVREISAQLSTGVEESIERLFKKLSEQHSWYPECAKNIHYYNGWATNKAHKVGMKVILPINGYYCGWRNEKKIDAYRFCNEIADLERALSYLDGDGAICRIDTASVAKMAEERQHNSMTFTYFDATFYKKGTCHIKFHPEAAPIIDRLNIFAARNRGWLPPCYGKKRYDDMTDEEKTVIDSFQGLDAYEKVMADPSRYIMEPGKAAIPMLTA